MSPAVSTPAVEPLVAAFEAAAVAAGEAEGTLRKQMEAEILRLERERAFAYRRLNFVRTLSDGIHSAENEEAAVARGCAVARTELGWESDSETRTETLSRLVPFIRSAFACRASEGAEAPVDGAAKTLADFEAWYMKRFGQPFWMLFERHIEELPLVER
jgi:hypothetical protein